MTAETHDRSLPDTSMTDLVERFAWPTVLAAGLAVFFLLYHAGIPALPAAYTGISIGAALVVLHERLLPYRQAWRPDPRTVVQDGLYMAVVQGLLPKLLALPVAVALVRWAEPGQVAGAIPWPHGWPIWAQAALMLLVSDFLRYWLHRLAHAWGPLWRLHAVHHAPDRLYWLNVGRFHPLDKASQFLFDALPFLLAGVSDGVIAAYFTFYALNGFYQHSNCRLRLGPLNWLVAGPELHRWHHADARDAASVNFGNNLILWDHVFGTRFLPPDRDVRSLGNGIAGYPDGFLAQLAAPFRRARS